jgi:hypothetical protein
MSPTPKTLHMKSEPELAIHQSRQVGNTCSFHAIAISSRMLLNYTLDPISLSEEVNRLWWRGRFMRVAPDWAVTPRMQVRIVRYLAQTQGLPILATYQHGDPDALPEFLSDLTRIPIITIIWPWRKAPPIYLGSTSLNFNDTRSAGAHSMILAAYDPQHSNVGGQINTPWGFINPWKDNAAELFWMTDEDFRRAWRFWLPGVGRNSLVIIQHTLDL